MTFPNLIFLISELKIFVPAEMDRSHLLPQRHILSRKRKALFSSELPISRSREAIRARAAGNVLKKLSLLDV